MNANLDHLKALRTVECRDSSFVPSDDPLVFVRASGSRVWDAEGREYIDMCAGFGALPFGHNPSFFTELCADYAADQPPVTHAMGDVYPSLDKVELLTYLAGMLPDRLTKGALALTGGQAVEIAMKSAMLASQRSGFIAFKQSYHGLDLGVLPTTWRSDFRQPFQKWLPDDQVTFLDFASPVDVLEQQFHAALRQQQQQGFGTAAVVVEPIQGRGGVIDPGHDWRMRLSELCREAGVLLIFDEIFTGFGRTGRLFFAEEVPCDLICLGKALGSGMPLSACFGTEEVMGCWPENRGEAIHTGTFFGHPLSCRVALAGLKSVVASSLVENARRVGERFRSQLEAALPYTVRGEGLMLGIEMEAPGAGVDMMNRLRGIGVIALPSAQTGSVLSLTPALNVSENDLDQLINSLKSLI